MSSKEAVVFIVGILAFGGLMFLYSDLRRSLNWVGRQAGKAAQGSSVTFSSLRELMGELETQEEELVQAATAFERLIRILPIPVLIHQEGVVLYANEAFSKLSVAESPNDELVTIFNFIEPQQRYDLFFKLQEIYTEQANEVYYLVKVALPDGSTAYVETRTILAFFKGQRAALTVIGNIIDDCKDTGPD